MEFVSGSVTSPASGVTADFDSDESSRKITATLTGASGQEVKLKIVTKITDEDFFERENSAEYINTARLQIGSKKLPEVQAKKTIQYTPLSKELVSYNENTAPYANYKLTVNPAGEKLGGSEGTIQLIDTMSDNLSLVPGTIAITNLKTGETLTSEDYTLAIDSDENRFTLTLPDETPLEITYKAYVQGQSGDTVDMNNTAVLQAEDTKLIEVESKREMVVEQSRATATGNPKLTICKVDSENVEKTLSGAEFELSVIKDVTKGEEESLKADNLEKVDTYVTDENGRIVFNNLSYDTWYCYQEVSAPDGYMLDSTPKAFIILSRNSEITDIPDWVTQASSGLRVYAQNDAIPNISVSGTKTWADEDADSRPTSIQVILQQNGKDYIDENGDKYTKTVTAADDWKYTFENLPECDENGNAYEYSVKEGYVEGYTSEADGMDLRNIQDYEGYYYEGTIRITKQVLLKGDDYNVRDVYYAGIFQDADFTEPLTNDDGTQMIVPLVLDNESETTVEISVPFNEEDSATYYITEVDEDGTPVENAKGVEYKASVKNGKGVLDTQDTEGSVTIVNRYEKAKAAAKGGSGSGNNGDSASGSATQTGDDSSVALLALAMMAAITVMAILAVHGRNRNLLKK